MTHMTMTPEIEQLKAAHRATWASGDYAAVAEAFVRDGGRTAVAKAAVEPGRRCSTSPPAPGTRRSRPPSWARVTALDLVPELLGVGRELAREAGVEIEWVEGDAEALPYPVERFDTVLSVLGGSSRRGTRSPRASSCA